MKRDTALHIGISKRSIAIHSVGHVVFGNAQAVGDPVVLPTARHLHAGPKRAQRTALEQQIAVRAFAALVTDHVDDTSDGVRPVERRSGAAQHFDAVRIGKQQILNQSRGISLRGRSIAEPQTIH